MARITVEDCRPYVKNDFELVLLSAQRAREIAKGAPTDFNTDKEPKTVVALRDIAAGHVDPEQLRDNRIRHLMRNVTEIDAPEDEEIEIDYSIIGNAKTVPYAGRDFSD